MGKTIQKNKITYYATLSVYAGIYEYSHGIVLRGRLDIIADFIDREASLRVTPIYIHHSISGQYLTDVLQWIEQKGYTRVED
jgi:hypothetical protein